MAEFGTDTQQNSPAIKPLAIGYRSGSGESLVYGSFMAAALGVLLAFITDEPWFLVLAAVGLGGAYYYRPYVESKRPQLGANADGLYLERLGFIAWADIADIQLFETSVRSIQLQTLKISLNRPLKETISKPEKPNVFRYLMARCWRRTGPRSVDIAIHSLEANPDNLLARLRSFLPR
ncbi:MAG: hypothetical protein ABJN26_11505 [Stappiaceae bacterium]